MLSVTDYRHCVDTRSSPERLQDSVNATLYIDRRSILLADHCSHFSYHFMYIYHLIPIDLQSSCSFFSSHCKAYINAWPAVGLAARLVAGLAASYIAGVIGVVGYTGVL